MFLPPLSIPCRTPCFLHARGDVSDLAKKAMSELRFSPRTWRCFYRLYTFLCYIRVFSTHVEMFLRALPAVLSTVRFLHARGDVSYFWPFSFRFGMFSPRTWRCFSEVSMQLRCLDVFSTHVEMFLRLIWIFLRSICFLHARGDVSKSVAIVSALE